MWTWTAIDAETKLVPCWMVGPRDAAVATEFMQDLAGRLAKRVQLTTGRPQGVPLGCRDAFGSNIDYAMLVKIYGEAGADEKRYSPADYVGSQKVEM